MPTTNPVPSQDPSDLLFNAGKLDEVLNGTGNSFTDRLGVARRTVAGMNADFDAQLADAESDLNVYRADAAASAAEALGYLQTIRATSYGAYAEDPATDPLGNPPTVGDEYFNTTSNLLKRWNGTTWQASDINTANLAAPGGSSLVGFQPAGTGAVATTAQSKLRERVSVFDFLDAQQIAYIQAGDVLLQDATAVTAAIHSAIATGKKVYFPDGAYKHTGIIIGISSNQVHLEGAGWSKTRLFCTTAAAHSIFIKNTGTTGQYYTFPTIKNLHIDGNDTNGCGIYGDGVVWYCFENLRITNQGSHGILLTDSGTPSGGSYLGVTRNVYSSGNVGDGFYQVATKGADQQNASWILNSEFQGNANGVTIWGAAINIKDSALEGNSGYGLRIMTTNTGAAYPAQRISAKDNYLENNAAGHIYVKTRSSSGLIEGLSIEDNYYFSPNNLATYVAVQFDCGSDQNEVRGFSFKGNQFLFTNTPTVVADFDNGLANDCLVAPRFQLDGTPDFSAATRYVNLGQAKFSYVKSQTVSGYFLSKGNVNITYSAFEKSTNVAASGNAKFPLSLPLNSSIVQFSVPVETDATNYSINFILYGKSLDGTSAHSQIINIPVSANSGSKTVKTAVAIAYTTANRVIGSRADMYMQLSVTLTTPGTFFYLGNPTVFYVDA